MYLIEAPDSEILKRYYAKFRPPVISEIRKFLNGFSLPVDVGSKNKIKVNVQVTEGSFAEKALRWLVRDDNLRVLLLADPRKMRQIIRIVELHDRNFRKKLSKSKYRNLTDGCIVSDFNYICRYIFIDQIYDNSAVFDKTEFIIEKGLTICPYCGAKSIKPIRKNAKAVIKHHIDHYYPKSLYPFFAMTYYNLIPSCMTCNDSPNKGSFDPYNGGDVFLPHPHEFNDQSFRFQYTYNLQGQYDPENFTSHIDYGNNTALKTGYTEGIAIEQLYEHDPEMQKMWTRMQAQNDNYKALIKKVLQPDGLELPAAGRNSGFDSRKILGFGFGAAESRIYEKYKFQKDIFNQMLSDLDVQ